MVKYFFIINIGLSTLFLKSASAISINEHIPKDLIGIEFQTKLNIPLSSFNDQIIYLDFWASWCKPCRKILPALESLHNQYKHQNITVIAINIDEHKNDAIQFLKQYPISYTKLYDPNGLLAKRFNVRVMPTGILIDQNGIIKLHHIGYEEGDIQKLEIEIKKLLKLALEQQNKINPIK